MKTKIEEVDEAEDVDDFVLGRLHPQVSETISLSIPTQTLWSLERVAASRDMSLQALLKFYIGQCLRQDLDRVFGERVLAATTDVLREHLTSDEEVTEIMESIQRELRPAA